MGKLTDRAKQNADAGVWKPARDGDSIEGMITAIKQGGQYDSTHYYLDCEDGECRVVCAGNNTVLGGLLRGEHLNVGDEVAIVYLGERESKSGRTYKGWSVVSEKHANNRERVVEDDDVADDDSIPF